MIIDEIKDVLCKKLSQKRFRHSVNVMNTAAELGSRYGEDIDKAALAGLLHDCARDIKGKEVYALCRKFGIETNDVTRAQPELLHGPIGAEIAKTEFGVNDKSVLDAIRWHTTGHENMDMLGKIIYIADYIEPGRTFPGLKEVRELAYKDLDAAMVISLDRTIKHVIAKGALIHPYTIGARNSIIMKNMKYNNEIQL